MDKIKTVLERSGLPAVRLVWKVKRGQTKPDSYITFQRMSRLPLVNADDGTKEETETWYVRLITRKDFETMVDNIVERLREAGYGVTSVDQEIYENDTGYWIVPITVQAMKE